MQNGSTNKIYNILLVDDDIQVLNVLNKILSDATHNILHAFTIEEAFKIYKSQTIHLIFIDYNLPDGLGTVLLEDIRKGNSTLPIIMLTGTNIEELKFESFDLGTNFFMRKPFNNREVKGIVYNMLSLFDAYEDLENANAVIVALSATLETRDKYTQGHSQRVADLSLKMYDAIGFDDANVRNDLYLGCLLHDIGKIGIADDILKSPNELDKESYEEIKKHPDFGVNICKDLKKIKNSLPIIQSHHEKLDGSGYPQALKEEDIADVVQIATVADIYDALTSSRSYREAMPTYRAFDILQEDIDAGKINSYFVDVLKKIILQGEKNEK